MSTDHTPTPTGPGADDRDRIPATATEWIICAHATAARAVDKVFAGLAYYCSEEGHREHVALILRTQDNYALALAIATLERYNKAAAAALAENLHDAAEAGDGYGEWLWQWGEELQAGQPITLPFDPAEQQAADAVTVTVARADARYLVDTWADLTGTRGRIVDAYRTALEATP